MYEGGFQKHKSRAGTRPVDGLFWPDEAETDLPAKIRQHALQACADQQINKEEEDRGQRCHDEDHDRGHHNLAPGWPHNLCNLCAGLIDKSNRVGHRSVLYVSDGHIRSLNRLFKQSC